MKSRVAMLLGWAVVLSASAASAHVSVSSGPAVANTTQIVTFGVGHGCAGADTFGIQITIPTGVTSVRALPSDFGNATVQTDSAGAVTTVSWQKRVEDVLPGDTGYYEFRVRMRVPNSPFTTVYFPVRQTCRSSAGVTTTVDWNGTPSTPVPDGGSVEPAAALNILPARQPGWNRYTIPQNLADLATFFRDALIVWRGTAAYSSNPNTTTQIMTTAGVTALTALNAADQVWVRY